MKYTFVENMNSENLLDCEPPAALKLLMLQTSRPKHSFYYFKVKYSYFWFPIISFWSSKNETQNPKNRRREGRWRINLKFYIFLKFDIFPTFDLLVKIDIFVNFDPFVKFDLFVKFYFFIKYDFFSNYMLTTT